MAFCAYCGTQVGDDVAACPECGHPQGVPVYIEGEPHTVSAPIAPPAEDTPRGRRMLVAVVIGVVVITALGIGPALYLKSRNGKSNDVRSAELALSNSMAVAKQTFAASHTYLSVTPQSLTAAQPGTTFIVNGESTGPTIVSVFAVSQGEIRFAVKDAAGKCHGVRDVEPGTFTGGEAPPAGTRWATREVSTTCTASSFGPLDYNGLVPSSA